jgi:hypothetical protein
VTFLLIGHYFALIPAYDSTEGPFLSTFRNFGFADVFRFTQGNSCVSEMKRKTSFPFAFLSTFRNFANKLAKLLRLGKKRNEFLCFALDFS